MQQLTRILIALFVVLAYYEESSTDLAFGVSVLVNYFLYDLASPEGEIKKYESVKSCTATCVVGLFAGQFDSRQLLFGGHHLAVLLQ